MNNCSLSELQFSIHSTYDSYNSLFNSLLTVGGLSSSRGRNLVCPVYSVPPVLAEHNTLLWIHGWTGERTNRDRWRRSREVGIKGLRSWSGMSEHTQDRLSSGKESNIFPVRFRLTFQLSRTHHQHLLECGASSSDKNQTSEVPCLLPSETC